MTPQSAVKNRASKAPVLSRQARIAALQTEAREVAVDGLEDILARMEALKTDITDLVEAGAKGIIPPGICERLSQFAGQTITAKADVQAIKTRVWS